MPRSTRFIDTPYPYHHELTLGVERLSSEGAGVCRDGTWVVMVPFALPGERIVARVWRNHRHFSEADLLEVLEPSPARIAPKCRLFGQCGGCQLQHLRYDEQLVFKRERVRDAYQRIGGLGAAIGPTAASPKPYGYRRKLTPHHAKPRQGEVGPIGFLRAQGRSLIDVERCELATEALNQALASARQDLCKAPPVRARGATLLLREHQEGVTRDPQAQVVDCVRGLRLHFCAGEFFQNNASLLPVLVDYVVDQVRATACRTVVDAYCGAGLFGLAVAPQVDEVIGVEVSERNLLLARANAAANGIGNARFVLGDAAEVFAQVERSGSDCAVIIDPPRRGCDEAFVHQLLAFRPKALIYVSCDAATQARDLRQLVDAGFRITSVRPFDMFPQTKHVECVATLFL